MEVVWMVMVVFSVFEFCDLLLRFNTYFFPPYFPGCKEQEALRSLSFAHNTFRLH